MKANGHYDSVNDTSYVRIYGNSNTLKAIMELESGYVVDFTPDNSLRTMLGFNAQMYNSPYNESPNPVNILNVNSILVNIDTVSGAYVQGTILPVIYSFFPNVSPGFKIVETPRNLVYLPINRKTISSVSYSTYGPRW